MWGRACSNVIQASTFVETLAVRVVHASILFKWKSTISQR